ncbi:MAG TPA: hypothetical protein VG605_18850 [Puia sp.]|nr:hypothetical protein [Puia sp.]
MADNNRATRLTKRSLQQLKASGYQYVLIKGYSLSRKVDYIELNSFMLTPVRELPEDPADKEIFAPVDSEILLQWASADSHGVEAYIEFPANH